MCGVEEEVTAEAREHHDGKDVVHRGTDIVGHEGGFDAGVFEDGTQDTHDSTASEQTGGEERALLGALLVDCLILAAGLHQPGEETAHQQREVQLQRDEHTERERQCGNADHVQQDSQNGAHDVKNPRGGAAIHHRLDDGRHGVCLRSHQGILTRVSVSLGQQHDDCAYRQSGNERAHELESLLFIRRRADPVTDFQIGDEAAGHGKCRTDDAAHHQCRDDARAALQPDRGEDKGGENQRHHRHAGDRVGAHCGDSRCYFLRPNVGVVYQTQDHVDHNVWGDFISRSFFSYQRNKADVEIHRFDLQVGDRIFLCTDGVCQFIAPDILTRRSMDDKSPEDVADVIQFLCEKFSKDNYTGILVYNE